MTLRFKGGKDRKRRLAVENDGAVDVDMDVDGVPLGMTLWPRAFRKTALTYAVPMVEPFTVETLEGVMQGKPGDWLAIGAAGEMYPIDAAVFAATHEEV